jgi:hypothetical protein
VPRPTTIDHETAIREFNNRLRKHGFVSFVEINNAAGGNALSRDYISIRGNPTARHVADLLGKNKHDYVLIPSSLSGGKGVVHVAEKPLIPFLKQIGGKKHHSKQSPLVFTLLRINSQIRKTGEARPTALLLSNPTTNLGTKILEDMRMIRLEHFGYGEKPEGLPNARKYAVLQPELLKRAALAVGRAIVLQQLRRKTKLRPAQPEARA